jgi:hypothetical protein
LVQLWQYAKGAPADKLQRLPRAAIGLTRTVPRLHAPLDRIENEARALTHWPAEVRKDEAVSAAGQRRYSLR